MSDSDLMAISRGSFQLKDGEMGSWWIQHDDVITFILFFTRNYANESNTEEAGPQHEKRLSRAM
jgi:hypothetical protein